MIVHLPQHDHDPPRPYARVRRCASFQRVRRASRPRASHGDRPPGAHRSAGKPGAPAHRRGRAASVPQPAARDQSAQDAGGQRVPLQGTGRQDRAATARVRRAAVRRLRRGAQRFDRSQQPSPQQQSYAPQQLADAPPYQPTAVGSLLPSTGRAAAAAKQPYRPAAAPTPSIPSQNPNAPGAPRPLGSLYASSGAEPPARLAHQATLGTEAAACRRRPPRNPNATGAQMATLPPSQSPRDVYDLAYGYLVRRDYALADQTLS